MERPWARKGTKRGQDDMNSSQFFVFLQRELRWALQHLYDPMMLRRSVLVHLFGLGKEESARSLQRILFEAVEALKPRSAAPFQAKAWRAYRALLHRYVEQFSQGEVAKTMGLSIRQLRREETLALRVLAEYLRTRYSLPNKISGQDLLPQQGPDGAPFIVEEAPSREQELRWLENSLSSEVVDVGKVIDMALRIASPLLQTMRVRIECALSEGLPRLAVRQTTLRQAILDTLTASARAIPGGRIQIMAESRQQQIWVTIKPTGTRLRVGSLPDDYNESLEMARQLTALSGGALQLVPLEDEANLFLAQLILPAAEQLAVLIIDDNADTLQLFQRYLADTRYPAVGTRDPQQAMILAEKLKPQIIILDVMLPGVDGWELLGRLREDPVTCKIPIIVCTILPEEQLAFTLGAAAFIRKPVSRGDLLAALDRLASCRQYPPESVNTS